MADIVDAVTRSRMMSGIRAQNTKPERIIRSLLHRAGFRFRLHVKDLPGKPDIVLPKYRVVIHVHGCYWHGHDCDLFRMPSTRRLFWKQKIHQNQTRDARVISETLVSGWRHLTVWECAIRGRRQIGLEVTTNRITRWIAGNRKQGVIRSRRK